MISPLTVTDWAETSNAMGPHFNKVCGIPVDRRNNAFTLACNSSI